MVFEKDLQMSFYKERYFVNEGNNKLPTVQLTQFVKDSFPLAKINGIKVYEDALRSAEINVSFASKKETKPADRQAGYTIFIDPYNGKILEKYNYKETFFYNVFALHRWLLGGNKGAGKYIVGVSTLIFLFVITTGIILWWPKTKKILQQRIKIKSNAGWKRLNHDLHIVFGFYSALFLFIIAFTGLAWSFEWFNKGIYTMTNSPLKNPPPPQSIYISNTKTISFDEALATAKTVYPNADFYSLSMPKDSVEAVTVAVLNKNALHESATDAVYVDQYSGVVLGQLAFEERSLGAKVRSTFKPVHTGSIWGMPSKIIAFIVCLFGVSFPITGTIMWMNRTRKKKIASIKTKDKAMMV